jgi:hypothetical protein
MNPLRLITRLFQRDTPPPALDDVVLLVETDEGPAIAEMWRGMLESDGIRAMVQGGDPMQIYGFVRVPMKLFVRRRDLPRAREVLSLGRVRGEDA